MSGARSRPPQEPVRAVSELRLHPLAGLIPAMRADEYRALVASVAECGVITPVEVTPAGVVLDGRHRLEAAGELGLLVVPVRVVVTDDEVAYMARAALVRRHLSVGQKAAIAIELYDTQAMLADGRKRRQANLKRGVQGPDPSDPTDRDTGDTRRRLARVAGVGEGAIQTALNTRERNPELFEQLKTSELSVTRAAQLLKRDARYAQIDQAPPLPEGPFELIYADPPWQMGNPGGRSAPEQHYPTLPLDEIAAIPIPAAETAILYLWAVASLLPQTAEVLEQWGFEYLTNIVWDKQSRGLGNRVAMQHEHLLIGVRGNYPLPHPTNVPPSVIQHPRGQHSEKPEVFYELIETAHPNASRLELFARNTRPGWASWGNQLPTVEEPDA